MKKILSNIQYVERCLVNSTFQENKAMLNVLLSETIELGRTEVFTFQVPFTSIKDHSHIVTYKKCGKQYKAKLIADLEELQRELGRRQPNVNRSLQIVSSIMNTNLYQDYTKTKIDQWRPLRNNTVTYEKLFVS
ncbi:hypothetical protein GJU41_03000 [Bacillus idriensis]|uniref:Uncharacterized protein n=1 Tax=Metabacillus idriensis TaxID=324768 RepID=A0A6I2M4Q3_9BACI|nr:hypothetical protein [Metabacillus idriensis]MRX52929.1 hypothetical protein [Metabacillus idriensis]